jgi:flagellar assembly factor FliW
MAEQKIVEIETRLGPHKIAVESIVRFPRGLIGYEDKRDFVLLRIREDVPFMVLQSLDDPGLGLMVADPYGFMPDYSFRLGDAEQNMLNINSPEDLSVLVTVTIPVGRPEEACLNLTGPVAINHEARLGLQVPQSEPGGLPVKFPLRGR